MREHAVDTVWPAGERVMVCIDDQPRSQNLVRRAWRRAQRSQGALIAVFVETHAWANARPEAKQRLEENLRFAEDMGAELLRVQDDNPVRGLLRVAHDKNVDSITIGQSHHGPLHAFLRGSVVQRLLRAARDVDVHVVADRNSQA